MMEFTIFVHGNFPQINLKLMNHVISAMFSETWTSTKSILPQKLIPKWNSFSGYNLISRKFYRKQNLLRHMEKNNVYSVYHEAISREMPCKLPRKKNCLSECDKFQWFIDIHSLATNWMSVAQNITSIKKKRKSFQQHKSDFSTIFFFHLSMILHRFRLWRQSFWNFYK